MCINYTFLRSAAPEAAPPGQLPMSFHYGCFKISRTDARNILSVTAPGAIAGNDAGRRVVTCIPRGIASQKMDRPYTCGAAETSGIWLTDCKNENSRWKAARKAAAENPASPPSQTQHRRLQMCTFQSILQIGASWMKDSKKRNIIRQTDRCGK
ncbi:hypothetical protein H6P81_005707 [Aristolochia fimbriata]|uniref:Uncharacterized protein n=1 Tax=Aristolochia fimbriata TaxID=158543 RepID=A0AAV7EVP8_ARIFI|nr:hypothetical protein H6P81_005707 [Aristolochia fimbriata]